jgi:hypothetical protein
MDLIMSKKPTKEAEMETEMPYAAHEHLPSINEPPGSHLPDVTFTVVSIEPTEAEIGSSDLTLHVHGTGFGKNATIVFNGGVEPTTRVSSSHLTTTVKPSTAGTPGTYPVTVEQGGYTVDPPQSFTFTEAEAPASRRRK